MKTIQYQQDTLAALRQYLSMARTSTPKAAFNAATASLPDALRREYMVLSDAAADAPYICLRLPTGGGKTLLAALSIPIAGKEFLDQDYPLVLWLVPTKTIRDQTIKALQTPGNMHYEALDAHFKGRFRVLSVADFDQLRPHDLGARANIVVSTLATARVDNTEIRKVYAHNENMEPFFAGVSASPGGPGVPSTALFPGLERDEKRRGNPIKYSFANLLHLCRPLVIVDEAHNNTSDLSTEVMGRLNPSCVIEFTATPASNSNILYHATAGDLYAASMIKLPIELTQHATWQEAVHSAVQERQKLAELAPTEKDYIRPVTLIQAENIDKEVTWQVVLDYLQKEESIPREKIAVATGAERELDGIDLFSPQCPIEHVITVKALKEGWDCSFAYVFCSVATVHSKTEVEQILGRVLRMPYAERRSQPALNRAYAHVSSTSWPYAVQQLRDRLVDMGFDEIEAEEAIREQRPKPVPQLGLQYPMTDPTAGLPLFGLAVAKAPDLAVLDADEQGYVAVRTQEDGTTTLSIDDNTPETALRKVERQLQPKERAALRETLAIRRRQRQRDEAPVRKGKSLVLPRLCRLIQDELEIVEQDTLVGPEGWNLAGYPATLTPEEFSTEVEAKRYEVSIEGKRVVERYLGAQMTLDLKHMEDPWTEDFLIGWIVSHIEAAQAADFQDVKQCALTAFVRSIVRYLVADRALTLADLQRYAFSLQKAVDQKIRQHRAAAFHRGFQQLLALPGTEISTSFDYAFAYPADGYQPQWYYQGSRRFTKHFYPEVGELKSDGEEFDCAVALDECPSIQYWVRNLDHGPSAFSLPIPAGRFFPDFAAKLTDGRIMLVEYKGEHLEAKTSEQEKRDIGRLWEKTSVGKALFLWAVKQDAASRPVAAQITTLIAKQPVGIAIEDRKSAALNYLNVVTANQPDNWESHAPLTQT
jgi:type III restriction enzyme